MKLRESCGVFGVYTSDKDVFHYLYWGMLAQNHRGHQSHGFAILKNGILNYKGLGLIPNIKEGSPLNNLFKIKSSIGIANVRYATSGPSDVEALQRDAMPICVSDGIRSIAISFNGNIINVRSLQKRVGVDRDYSDTHALALLILQKLREKDSITEAAHSCMKGIDGSFSVTGITDQGTLFAFKDPVGIKPLCYGTNGHVHAFSSESVGLDINDLEFIHELRPGELLTVVDGEFYSEQLVKSRKQAFCSFEFAYFARPDSKLNGKYVYEVRKDLGAALARTYQDKNLRCDQVISMPETANDATYGFHEETGLPWNMATRRHRYMTQRAFIVDSNSRKDILSRKINILKDQIKDKNIAIIDDSIVRGDTTRTNIKRFRDAGAKEIHMFITFPRIIGPCFYGIDMSTYSELIGTNRNPSEVATEIGADSVNYLSIEDYVRATGMVKDQLCLGCITGNYPTSKASELAAGMKTYLQMGEKEEGRINERKIETLVLLKQSRS